MEGFVEKLEALGREGLWRSVETASLLALRSASSASSSAALLDVRLLHARAVAASGETRRAAELLEALAAEHESEARVARALLQLCWTQGRAQEAVVWGEKISSSLRTPGDNWLLGCAYEAVGARKQASRCFMNVLRDNEFAIEALEALCRVGAAAADVQAFLAKRTKGGPSFFVAAAPALARAYSSAAAGQHREAAEVFAHMAASETPLAAEHLQMLRGEQLVLAGDEVPAVGPAFVDLRWTAAVLAGPALGSPRAFLAGAKMAGARGDFPRALTYAAKAQMSAPRSDVAFAERCHLCSGHALAGLGQLDEALAAYRRAGRVGLESVVRTLGRLGRPQEALRVAKAEYRARPQLESALSALADALALHSSGKAKSREVLVRCLRAGGPRPRHVLRLAVLEEQRERCIRLLLRAIGEEDASVDDETNALVPRGSCAGSWQVRISLARLLLSPGAAPSGATANDELVGLASLRAAERLGAPASLVQAELARRERREDAEEGDEDPPRPANNAVDPPPNPFLSS